MKSILTSLVLLSHSLLLLSACVQVTGVATPVERDDRNAAATEQSEASGRSLTLTSETIGARFVYIPAGSFMMGGLGFGALPQHKVTISKPFYLQETELTQGQWRMIMGNNPSYFKDCGDHCPVEKVSWNDAQDFIRKLNQKEGQNRYRLPTEAEWEYAARSGGKEEEYAGTNSRSAVEEYAWYICLLPSCWETHPVRQKKANGLSLYDMSGNVSEWVQDWYGTYPSGNVTDPVGPSSGTQRVHRGGSWRYGELYCRTTYRGVIAPGLRYSSTSDLGFRLVMMP